VPESEDSKKEGFNIQEEQKIPVIPDFKSKDQVDVRYPLIEPFAYAHIYWDSSRNELIYQVEEPIIDESEQKTLNIISEGIKELINMSFIAVNKKETVIEYLEKNVKLLISELGLKITEDTYYKVMYYIYRDFVGLNEIEPLMKDYHIEDIECNGLGAPIYIVHRKFRNIRTSVAYTDMKKLANFVEKLAQKSGRYVSYSNPLLDASLPDGSRVNATYTEDVSSKGPTFTIRKFTKTPWTPTKMIETRTLSPEIMAYLWLAVEYEFNILMVGGTGSGKTSLLNTIAFFIPPQARVVSIEDTHELQLSHDNWLPSVAREGSGSVDIEGRKHGEVTLFDLLKESFRQNPNYVIVGEIRGAEAYVLFQGMASGHPSFGTMHANDVPTVVRRLETPPINLSPALVESLDTVCLMAHVTIKGAPARRLKAIQEVVSVGQTLGDVKLNTPFVWDPATDRFFFKTQSRIFEKITTRHGVTKEQLASEFRIRSKLLMEMLNKKIFDSEKVQEIIHRYYKNPKDILKEFNIDTNAQIITARPSLQQKTPQINQLGQAPTQQTQPKNEAGWFENLKKRFA